MQNRLQISVHLVGAGPGDPGLITPLGLECLQQAQVVIFDRLANPLLLSYAPEAEWIDAGKQPDHHMLKQDQINELIIQKVREGKKVVRLKGGDPYVFGRGGEEAIALTEAGIPFEIVPGVTSAIAAPAYAGIPVTHRNIAQSVTFITGHSANEDNLPQDLMCVAGSKGTLVFLMGIHNLPEIIARLRNCGRSEDTPVALVEQGTCSNQKTITGTLADILEKSKEIQPPAVIIVGEVVNLREKLRWFDTLTLSPLLGTNILSTLPLTEVYSHKKEKISKSSFLLNNQLDDFSYKVSLLGANAIHLPAYRLLEPRDPELLTRSIHELSNQSSPLPGYDWVLFTNSSDVIFFMHQIKKLGYDSRIFSNTKIGVIGVDTANTLENFGLSPDLTLTTEKGRLITSELETFRKSRLLLPLADRSFPGLGDSPKNLEITLDTVAVTDQERIPINLSFLKRINVGKIDIATFFSPSAIQAIKASLTEVEPGYEIKSFLKSTKIACIDRATATAAKDVGLNVEILPDEPSIEGLIQAILSSSEAN